MGYDLLKNKVLEVIQCLAVFGKNSEDATIGERELRRFLYEQFSLNEQNQNFLIESLASQDHS
jgi:hypothetical protein